MDAEYFVNLPGCDYMKRTAVKICKKYIYDDARLQVNISAQTKNEIYKNMEHPTRNLFKKAQNDIFKLLETDVFTKFTKTEEVPHRFKSFECFEVASN